ncbi:DUF5522 domain-containing protein [Limnoglobus roseus]|uniref:Uncharacterized protein n=1 Tax=Limnoglobus roseus TaxID=2598579 RepID=A0A5C1AK53_9BACT|nr:DUF5522 domain-containing protein [Limnoglobus roseus]QEL18072.1 hypothetical protein PX52LOC_05086 [Limnoglobus roseus]
MDEKPTPRPLVENRDYYLENGKWVFTALFLRERGYCCENRCRHCPYGFPQKASDGDAKGVES